MRTRLALVLLAFAATLSAQTHPNGVTFSDSWSLGVGGRRYFAPSDLRPFAEAGGGLRWTEFPTCPHVRSPFASATGGVAR